MAENQATKKKNVNDKDALTSALRKNLKRRKKAKNKTLLSGMKKAILLFMVGIFCTGCMKKTFQHGYNLDTVLINEINQGVTTKTEVQKLLGSPSVETHLTGNAFIYFGKKFEQIAFLDPKVIEQHALIIRFNQEGLVTKIIYLNADDIKELRIDPNRTRLTGNEITILEQLLSNVGRFNSSMITGQ